MTREEPSLEMLWLQNIETMDKVQRIDHNNTVPSSKTFREGQKGLVISPWFPLNNVDNVSTSLGGESMNIYYLSSF
jgi:hypothetical protein